MSAGQPGSRRVLVVCLGNHCRSPLAAAALARHAPPGTEVRSAGLAGKHQGRPAHPAMTEAAAALGYDLTGHAGTQLTPQMLDWADLVLAMDSAVLARLRGFAGDRASPEMRLYLLDGGDVPDPWGKDADAFAACARTIEDAARRQAPVSDALPPSRRQGAPPAAARRPGPH
jgi:protein-tyrosine phosphatase